MEVDSTNDKIHLLQHNLHRRKEANLDISHWTTERTIALCQEPNHTRGKINNINRKLRVLTGFGGKPRACIILHPDIDYFQLNQFSNDDMVTITIKTTTNKTIIVA